MMSVDVKIFCKKFCVKNEIYVLTFVGKGCIIIMVDEINDNLELSLEY